MKKKIAIIFGGKSAEFEVSLNSASNIFNAIDKDLFETALIGIDREGKWFLNPNYSKENINLQTEDFFKSSKPILIEKKDEKNCITDIQSHKIVETFDIAFSIIHGTFGEDGTLQGFFKTLNIPFVGPDVLGSAICMDKEVTKRLLRDINIPIADFITLRKSQNVYISFEEAKEKLGLPMFIKPCNAGSAVGVNKVTDKSSFENAITEAFKYDHKLLIEEAVIGKEIECAILGNENPKASVLGEIIPTKDFYTYDAKYNDSDGAKMKIPAEIDAVVAEQLRAIAIEAFKAVSCEGLSRVDFFLRADNSFVLNEINTLPGFTEISMYPKLWESTGVTYSNLISELIDLTLERSERDNMLGR